MRKIGRVSLSLFIGLIAVPITIASGIVIDFEKLGPYPSSLEAAGVEVISVEGLPNAKMAPPGHYEVRVSTDTIFSFEAERVDMTLEFQNLDRISTLRFKTKIMTIEEALVLAEEFHALYGLETLDLYDWIEKMENDRGRGFYSGSYVKNYPAVGISLLRSYHPIKPVRVQFFFDWNSITKRHRGTSVENNKISGIRYDVDNILTSTKSYSSSGDVVSVIRKELSSSSEDPVSQKPVANSDVEGGRDPVRRIADFVIGLILIVVVLSLLYWRSKRIR